MAKSMVTLKSIAEEADTSVTTVSRVLRNGGEISEATRQHVLKVAEKLRYRPNLAAQSIFLGRTNSVGVIMPSASQFDARIAFGIHDGLAEHNIVPVTLWSSNVLAEKVDEKIVLRQIHQLIDRRVDAFILRPNSGNEHSYISEIWERNVPLVTVDQDLLESHGDFVGTDDELGSRMAANHLLELGHRDIAQIAGPDWVTTGFTRRKSFEQVITAIKEANCRTIIDESFGLDSEAIERLFEMRPMPTAVFASNDFIAAKIFQKARSLSLSIPRDLSVVGYANLEFSEILDPPLTTIKQDPYELGKIAAKMAIERITGKVDDEKHRKKTLKPELIVRSSTSKYA